MRKMIAAILLISMCSIIFATEVFFFATDGNDYEIYSYNVEDQITTQLTDNTWDDTYPVLSPDRQTVYYSSMQSGTGNIWKMAANGESPVQLTDISNHSGDTDQFIRLDINPAGTELVFSHKIFSSGGYFPIYRMNVDGSGLVQISPTNDDYTFPRWSPDGSRIMTMRNTPYNGYSQHIVVFQPDGSDLQTIVPNESNYPLYPAWSPDGNQIVFARNDLDLYTIDIDGTNEVPLGGTATSETYSFWAADGYIYYANDYNMERMLPDGSAAELLLDHPTPMGWMNVYPEFSHPDSLVAYYAFNGDTQDMSGNNHHGNNAGATPAIDRFGQAESSFFFDGNAYVSVPNSPEFITNSTTISVWARFNSIGEINLVDNVSDGAGFELGLRTSGGIYGIYFQKNGLLDGINASQVVESGTMPALNEWIHIVGVYESNTSIISLYVNNSLVDQDMLVLEEQSQSIYDLTIGRGAETSLYYMDGYLDDIRIYNKALAHTTIDSLYHERGWDSIQLVASYPFNAGPEDISGNGYNGYPVGGISFDAEDRFGMPNSSAAFNGIDSELEIPTEVLNRDRFSISMWFKANTMTDYDGLWYYGDGASNPELRINFLSGTTQFLGYDVDDYQYIINSQPTSLNAWHHIVAIADMNTGASLFMDGNLVGFDSLLLVGVNPASIHQLGRFNDESHPTGITFFDGLIDDVNFYNYAISPAEIDSLYHIGDWDPNDEPIAYYPFNGNANDESDHGLDGTIFGDVTSVVDRFGYENAAYYFDGQADYISLGNPDALNLSGAFSISVWIKKSGNGGTHPGIVSKFNYNTGDYRSYNLHLTSGNAPRFAVSSDGTSANQVDITGDNVEMDMWYHIVAIYDGTTLRLYRDGILSDSTAYSGGIFQSEEPVYIGVYNGTSYGFNGVIDDLRIYDRAISDTEVDSLYRENGWVPVSLDSHAEPIEFTLSQNYPNPFNPSTTIHYGLRTRAPVEIHIYNTSGREVWKLIQGDQVPGWYDFQWNGITNEGLSLPTGLYIAQIRSGAEVQSIKMAYLK